MSEYNDIINEANKLEQKAKELRNEAYRKKQEELKSKNISERLVYSAYSRCPCGAGLAYDPCYEDKDSVFVGAFSGYWDCSEILLGTAKNSVQHTAKLPFTFYEVLSQNQPSANGNTTRPKNE